MVRYGCKNTHQEDMCLKEIELHVQNLLIVLDSIGHIIHNSDRGGGGGGGCMTMKNLRMDYA